MRKISVQIVGDSRDLEKAFSRAGKAGGKFGSTMRGLGKVAAVGMGGGFLAAGLAMRRGFSELAEGQTIAAQTRAVLKSTGGAANVTSKQVDKLSTSIAGMSGLDDEAIAGAQNLLLTFTKIRNQAGKGNKVFDRATMAVTDMSVALGMDLNSAAMMVGKALNQMDVTAQGNVRGFMALRRVGVQITPTMMAAAKAFIEAGKPMEAQKLLLSELQTEFGGSAKAFGQTIQGTLGRLNNAFDELTASFAEGFLPMLQRVAKALTTKIADPAFIARVRELGTLIGTKLYNAFVTVSTWFKEHWGTIKQGFRAAGELARGLVTASRKIKDFWEAAAPVIATAIQAAFVKPMKFVLAAWAGVLEAMTHVPFVGGKFKGSLEAVNKAREGVSALDEGITAARNRKKRGPVARLGKGEAIGGKFAPGRARGGPVMAGMTYRVGERGPEMLTMGASGRITPNGGGGVHIEHVHLPGVTNATQFLKELQRIGSSTAASRRGRYGGSKLALG